MVYDKDKKDDEIQHQSFIHNFTTVGTFIKEIVKVINDLDMYTDSPQSHSRNKTVFNNVAHPYGTFALV